MFSAKNAPQSREPFALLPAGLYVVKINSVEHRAFNSGLGSQFVFGLEVLHPAAQSGTKFFHRCTFKSTSEKAQEIGHSELADLLSAIGQDVFRSPENLTSMCLRKEIIAETELEEDEKGGVWPRVLSVWDPAGQHRNPNRNQPSEPVFGETRRPIKLRKPKANSGHTEFSPGGFPGTGDSGGGIDFSKISRTQRPAVAQEQDPYYDDYPEAQQQRPEPPRRSPPGRPMPY